MKQTRDDRGLPSSVKGVVVPSSPPTPTPTRFGMTVGFAPTVSVRPIALQLLCNRPHGYRFPTTSKRCCSRS